MISGVFFFLVIQLKKIFYSNENEKARRQNFQKAAGCQPEKLNTQMNLYAILVEVAFLSEKKLSEIK